MNTPEQQAFCPAIFHRAAFRTRVSGSPVQPITNWKLQTRIPAPYSPIADHTPERVTPPRASGGKLAWREFYSPAPSRLFPRMCDFGQDSAREVSDSFKRAEGLIPIILGFFQLIQLLLLVAARVDRRGNPARGGSGYERFTSIFNRLLLLPFRFDTSKHSGRQQSCLTPDVSNLTRVMTEKLCRL